LLRRLARREPFWAAHRTHFYQRATDNGLTVTRVITEVFVLNIALATLAITSLSMSSIGEDVVLLLTGLLAVALMLYRFSFRNNGDPQPRSVK
jgi:hypothetical protein